MATTFASRELVRDELVSVFTTNGSWQEVYGYFPSVEEIKGKSPILIIRSRGTTQEMSGVFNNKASYRFAISSWVAAYPAAQTSSAAEDNIDTLDKTTRQVIRNNAQLTNGDVIRFDGGSEVADVIIEGLAYIVETRFVIVDLINGGAP